MRTKMTVELVAHQIAYRDEIRWADSLYGGGAFDFMDVLQHLPREIERPMLVGHNPGVEETVSHLLAPDLDSPFGRLKIRVPTAGMILLEADIINWNELKPGTCTLRWFLIPRLVKAMM
jgi:phosphohistidine phosphatase